MHREQTVTLERKHNPAGWVLYDGHCGFCSAGARRMVGLLKNLGFAIIPLQTPWVVDKLGADVTLSAQEMALLTRAGVLVGGIDAYIYVADQFWYGRPFARV